MRKIVFTTLFTFLFQIIYCQESYWQQQVNYIIDVTLNDKEHTLEGFEKIEYINNSPDTLRFIWFHIWPNAYKNERTAFSEQLLLNGNTKFYFSDKDERGYINRLDFKANNITLDVEDHPKFIDVVKLILPSPLAPGQKINITTPFHVKLPYNFSRGGHDGESYQVTQWYPKPAVYDKNGWHPMPYLDQGEFYSEFGNFDVRITIPANYVVAATGELQNEEEKQWLLSRKNFEWHATRTRQKVGGVEKTVELKFPASSTETKTLRYLQNNVHDFAWFADKRFIVNHDTCKLASCRVIDVFTYYTPAEKEVWKNSVQMAKQAIWFYSMNVGEYPYNTVSVVQGPQSFGGGMEYPTITVISSTYSSFSLEETILHEVGHNWFYGILASNERDHPWMDEGVNTFYQYRYYHTKTNIEKGFFEVYAKEKLDQPIETTSEKFSEPNYNLVAYYKTAAWLQWMEQQMGRENFDKAMKEYFNRWKFKHPQPEDFKKIFAENYSMPKQAFDFLSKTGLLPNQSRKGTLFKLWLTRGAIIDNHQVKTQITAGPSLGFNNYDKLMFGAFITNYFPPLNNLKFFGAPLYATGSKTFTGNATAHYSFYPNRFLRKADVFLNGSTFTMNKFVDTAGKKHFTSFQKIVPGFRLTLKERDARSTIHRYLQFKTFFIGEEQLRFLVDTIINGPDTSVLTRVEKQKTNRSLNQLKLVVENFRALYPYRAELNAEQGKGFIRFGFTGNYFFNYGKDGGGAAIRLFTGKFIYTNKSKANSFLYALSLSAPKGSMDYTYSNYFAGRNDYPLQLDKEKWTLGYQQIMIRDGGLKMNTDIQGNIGLTNNWLAALNGSFDIPSQINPLSVLPVKIPLKIFADVGTVAEFWDKESEQDRFLYDAGLQISFLKDLVNVYIPILYSPVYRDYLKSDFIGKKKFLRSISFSIDIQNFSLRKFDKNIPF